MQKICLKIWILTRFKLDYLLTFTNKFRKNYNKLESIFKKQILEKIELLSQNPNHPSLRSKRIQSTDNFFESSINMDIRVIWYYESERVIILVDIGHHEILK